MRKHIYDLLAEKEISPAEEYDRLFTKLQERYYGYDELYSDLNDIFRHSKISGSFLSLGDMFKSLKLTEDYKYDINKLYALYEVFLLLIESTTNITKDFGPKQKVAFYNQCNFIINGINYVLEKTGQMIIEEDEKIYIVEKSPSAMQAAELVEDSNISIQLLMYNRYALKGDLEQKKNILLALANYIEPLIDRHILKNNGYANIESDVGFLLNNLHIRHNNKDGADKQEYTASINDEELESWYDKTYNVILSFILAKEFAPPLKEIKEKYKWK